MTYELVDEESGVTFKVSDWNIEDILNSVTESSDFEEFDGTPSMWAYLMASKGGDEWTPDMIELIKENGITEPICIYRTTLGAYGIGNGHHRLVCAILMGMDTVPVAYTDTDEYYPNFSDGVELNKLYCDFDSSEMIYKEYTKLYKKLQKQEKAALAEEQRMR